MKIISNKSYWYVLPMLGETIKHFPYVRGCFLSAEEFPKYDNHIFVLFRKEDSDEYRNFMKGLSFMEDLVTIYSPDKFHDMTVFDVPVEHEYNYATLIKGKYSELAENYKRHIINFHKSRINIKAVRDFVGVLWKGPAYRKVVEENIGQELYDHEELASIIEPTKEAYLNEMKVLTNQINLDLLENREGEP